MLRSIAAAALLALAATTMTACDDKSPAGPSQGGNNNQPLRFIAQLSSANEVPPVSNADAGASGTMNITINPTRDSNGTIISATVDFNGTLAGFPPGTVITAAHIHTGAAGTNGGIVVNTAISAGEITLATGGGTFNKTNIAGDVATINAIIANPSAFYFNAHTALNPGGAVRGQLAAVN